MQRPTDSPYSCYLTASESGLLYQTTSVDDAIRTLPEKRTAKVFRGWNPTDVLSRLKISVAIAENFPYRFRDSVMDGIKEWAKAVDLQISLSTDLSGSKTIAVHWKPLPTSRLAQCYYPASMVPEPIAGDMTLNSVSEWDSLKVFEVVCHETGHALGLGHSRDHDAILYPVYRRKAASGMLLGWDDIKGAMELYRTVPRPGYRGSAGVFAP